MIPKTAFIALALVMVSAWAFGGFCDRLLIKWCDGLKTPHEDTEKRTCDNCKHGKTRPQDEPCCECLQDDDIDRWEAIE